MSFLLRFSFVFLFFTLYGVDCAPTPNETIIDAPGRPAVDIHGVDKFNLTEWIGTNPNEKEELQQWRSHLLEHASTSMTSLRYVMDYVLTNGVINYFRVKETPIHMEEIEWKPVNIDTMTIDGGKVRYGFLERYRDPVNITFYEGYGAFYEDMESISVNFEGSNETEKYYLWGRNYNKTPLFNDNYYDTEDKEVTFEVTKIYAKKWEAVADILKAPGDMLLKKYSYKLKAGDIYCYTYYCYGGSVKSVDEATTSHFVNTGRTKKKTWNWE